MTEDTLEKECDELMTQVADCMASPAEAESLANKFLSMTYRVNRRVRDVSNEIIKLSILEKTAYKTAFSSITDEKINVSKAKAMASGDKNYLISSVQLQKAENAKDYWKGVYEVFSNAHIFYKHLTRA